MNKKVAIIILAIVLVGLGGFAVYEGLSNISNSKKNDINNNTSGTEGENNKSIKVDDSKDYIYQANYSSEYTNAYTEYKTNKEVIKLSDIKVPYININSYYSGYINSELKHLYVDSVKKFDECAKDAHDCNPTLYYKSYVYNNILSVVVIEGKAPGYESYHTYNFDLTTGNKIEYNEMITKLGYDKNTILEKEKNALKAKIDEIFEGQDMSKACVIMGKPVNCYDIAYDLLDKAINNDTILYFTDNTGKLNLYVNTNDGSIAQNSGNIKDLIVIDK